MSKLPTYKIDRLFDAPRALVWKAWTDPALLAHWYGPNIETVIHKFELKAGGVWLNEMKMKERSMFSKMEFQQVVPEEKLVWLHASTDEDWNIASMMPGWPRLMLTTVTFEDNGAQTNVCLTQVPVDATEEEIAGFEASMAGMNHGWGKGYELIDALLADLKT